MDKTISIADNIHGTIHVSDLEKNIISTQAFNRLHNILQNSTAYLTYPSNQTKRFAHSLGVMHLGGKMFFHSMVNADEETKDRFFSDVLTEVNHLLGNTTFMQLLRDRLGNHIDAVLSNKAFLDSRFTDPLYTESLPGTIKPAHRFLYTLMFQAVRCAALLHDVGHPPFSHITESALEDVMKKVVNLSNPKPRHEAFRNSTEMYLGKKVDLHEQIGNTIADRLLEHVVRITSRGQTRQDAEKQFFRLLVHRMTTSILSEKGKSTDGEFSIYSNVHSIIAGPLDCDRLDYVTRDLVNSGYNTGQIEYERLISSMKLFRTDTEGYIFSFDVRTLSTIEDFFYRRWYLYNNLIYHHRVIKTDALLGRAITELALEYLDRDEEDSPRQYDELPVDISGLWRAIKDVYSDEGYFNALIQWDDSWLLTVLRQKYYSTYKRNDWDTEYTPEQQKVKDQLEELLSNKKNYRSVIKRMRDFLEIDNVICEYFRQNNSSLLKLLDVVDEDRKLVFTRNVESFIERNTEDKTFANGFFVENLRPLLDPIMKTDKDDQENYNERLLRIVTRVISEYGLRDSIAVVKQLKTGLDKVEPSINNHGVICSLSEVSRMGYELKDKQLLFPQFFLYISGQIDVQMSELRDALGRGIAQGLAKFIDDRLVQDE